MTTVGSYNPPPETQAQPGKPSGVAPNPVVGTLVLDAAEMAAIDAYLSSIEFPLSTYNNLLSNANTWTAAQTYSSSVNINATQTTIAGTTAGSFVASMPFQGSSYKKVIVYLNGYENDTTTAQTYTFPTAFTNTPVITTNSASVPGVSVSTTALSLAPDTTTAYTGWIIIEGY
ncbi:MAG: hypothetical protein QXU98_14285 [Candidatus Parvarchaeota archaeon]